MDGVYALGYVPLIQPGFSNRKTRRYWREGEKERYDICGPYYYNILLRPPTPIPSLARSRRITETSQLTSSFTFHNSLCLIPPDDLQTQVRGAMWMVGSGAP